MGQYAIMHNAKKKKDTVNNLLLTDLCLFALPLEIKENRVIHLSLRRCIIGLDVVHHGFVGHIVYNKEQCSLLVNPIIVFHLLLGNQSIFALPLFSRQQVCFRSNSATLTLTKATERLYWWC